MFQSIHIKKNVEFHFLYCVYDEGFVLIRYEISGRKLSSTGPFYVRSWSDIFYGSVIYVFFPNFINFCRFSLLITYPLPYPR